MSTASKLVYNLVRWLCAQELAWQFFAALKRQLRRKGQADFEDPDDWLPDDCIPGKLRAQPQEAPGMMGPRAPALPVT